jgi:pimeloyl-ACP methyl ester carboxylesterase
MANPFVHQQRRRRSWLGWGLTVLIGWVTIVVVLSLFERSLIFFPSRYPDGFWDTEAVSEQSGCAVKDCFFEAEDGTRLHAWWCTPPESQHDNATASMVLLWFHGNAGNLSHRAGTMIDLATHLPAQVMIVDYRGYGRSKGSPDEEGIYQDARAAWRFLTVDNQVPAEQIVIFGKSLGGAAAVDLATEVEPAGLIVQSSFSSIADMAAYHYPIIPRFIIRTRMDSLAKIREIECRKLFVHSPDDEIVPYALGRKLYEAAPGPKQMYEVPGAGHNTTILIGGMAYLDAVAEFVRSCLPKHR